MTETVQPAAPARRPGNGYDAAIIAEARKLVEETTLPLTEIGRQLSVPKSTLSVWRTNEGWVRPPGAPGAPAIGGARPGRRVGQTTDRAAGRRRRLVGQLYRTFERQLARLTQQATAPGETTDEKDARALATLARTLGTLMELERDEGVRKPAADAIDPDEIRARLARRLYALGQNE